MASSFAAVVAACAPVTAQTAWKTGVSGGFDDSSKWTGGVPSAFGDAVISVPGTYTVSYGEFPTRKAVKSLLIDNPTASVQLVDLAATNGVLVRNGNLRLYGLFSDSLTNEGEGLVEVGSASGPGNLANRIVNNAVALGNIELGGKLAITARIEALSLTLRPDSVLTTSGLGFQRETAGLLGSGTIVVDDQSSIGASYGPVEIADGIKIRLGRLNFEYFGGLNLHANSYASVDFNTPDAQLNLATSSFSGSNYGALIADKRNSLRNFSGTNAGTIAISAPAGQSTSISFNQLLNTGTATFVRTAVSVGTNFTNAASGTFSITDGSLVISDTGIVQLSQIASVQRTRSDLRVDGTLELNSSIFTATSENRLLLNGTIRGGTITGPANSVLTHTSTAPITFDGVTLNADLGSSRPVRIQNGMTVNNALRLSIGDSSQGVMTAVGSQSLVGSGTIELNSNRAGSTVGIVVPTGGDLTFGPDLTVRTTGGASFIGFAGTVTPSLPTSLINRGHLQVSAGSTLNLKPSNLINEGFISVDAGATLNLYQAHLSQLGNFSRADNSVVRLTGTATFTGDFDLTTSPAGPLDVGTARMSGGTLLSPGRAVSVQATDNGLNAIQFTNVNVAANLKVDGQNTELVLNASPLQNSTIALVNQASLTASSLTGTGTLSLTEFGTVRTNQVGEGIAISAGPGAIVSFRETVSTSPQRFDGPIAINGGSLRTATAGITTQVTTVLNNTVSINSGSLSSSGPLLVSATGSVKILSNGTLNASRGLTVDGSVQISPDATLIAGGVVGGVTPLDLRGTLAPSTTTTRFDTAPIFSSSSQISLTLGSSFPTAGRLSFAVPVSLAGTVKLTYDGTSASNSLLGSTWNLFTGSSLEGSIENFLATGFSPGFLITPTLTETRYSVRFDARFAGDANLDNRVELADLYALASNYNTTSPFNRTWSGGNFNGDNAVNLADLEILAANWQGTTKQWYDGLASRPNLPFVAIPEPSFALAAGVFGFAMTSRRRR